MTAHKLFQNSQDILLHLFQLLRYLVQYLSRFLIFLLTLIAFALFSKEGSPAMKQSSKHIQTPQSKVLEGAVSWKGNLPSTVHSVLLAPRRVIVPGGQGKHSGMAGISRTEWTTCTHKN